MTQPQGRVADVRGRRQRGVLYTHIHIGGRRESEYEHRYSKI